MSADAPVPALKVLDAGPVEFCERGSDHCEVPGLHAEAPEGAYETYPR